MILKTNGKKDEFELLLLKELTVENYKKFRYEIVKIRNIMTKCTTSFNQLSIMEQLEYCKTILLIVNDTVLQHSYIDFDSKREKPIFEYSISKKKII